MRDKNLAGITLKIIICMVLNLSTQVVAEDEPPINHPVVQHLKTMSDEAWPERGEVMQGKVKFVVGNDIWQPGQTFANGDGWLALVCSEVGCMLVPADLAVKQESWQGHYDENPTSGQKLLFKPTSGDDGVVVAWFHTANKQEWLKPGAVTSYYSPKNELKQPVGKGTLEVLVALPGGKQAQLVPMLLTEESLDKLFPEQRRHHHPRYLLQLRAHDTRQLLLGELGACYGLSDINPKEYLRWAGDIDRDGEADYLISFIDADGPVHLYLSSLRNTEQLVGLAGVYASPPFGGECHGGD